MGFTNARQNVRALLATGMCDPNLGLLDVKRLTGGNVEHAINYMLEGGGTD